MDEETAKTQRIEAARPQMAKLASTRRSRTTEFSEKFPTEWQPRAVVDPRSTSGEVFTDDSAWEFISELLSSGYPIKEIDLKHPPGKKGYEMVVSGANGKRDIYIKLQLRSGEVHGRSFHESTLTR